MPNLVSIVKQWAQSVPIDERQWGVLVESEEEVIVDIWIVAGDNITIKVATMKNKNQTIRKTWP